MKTINYDREEFRVGESIYGEQFQISIDEKRINEPEYLALVQRALKLLKQKTTKHRKENTIVFTQRKEKIYTTRYENNKVEPVEPYNKWLVAVIKKNERERENLTNIANMLKIN